MAKENPMDLDKILKVAVRGGASDVIMKIGERPRFRFNGELVNLSDGMPITKDILDAWAKQILPVRLLPRLETAGDADFAYQTPSGYRFRVNIFRQRQNLGMVMRVVSGHIRTLEELQLPKILTNLSREKRGLILVTGATGSGKTTTLAAMIQKINIEKSAHIITIEDPIEFLFKDERSTINQREIGLDAMSFASALRAALRQNPDIILVGELRDKETTECALMAAETGHLVLSTLHTTDAVESLTRLLSYFPAEVHHSVRQTLGHSLKAVISQRLVSRKDKKGLIAAHEIMIASANVRSQIEKGSDFHGIKNLIENGQEAYGMCSFDDSLMQLFQEGIISEEEVLAQSSSRSDVQLKLRGVG